MFTPPTGSLLGVGNGWGYRFAMFQALRFQISAPQMFLLARLQALVSEDFTMKFLSFFCREIFREIRRELCGMSLDTQNKGRTFQKNFAETRSIFRKDFRASCKIFCVWQLRSADVPLKKPGKRRSCFENALACHRDSRWPGPEFSQKNTEKQKKNSPRFWKI